VSDNPQALSIKTFLDSAPDELSLELICGAAGLETSFLTSERIQKLGLGFAGYPDYIHLGRLLLLGKSENSFLGRMEAAERLRSIESLGLKAISCILITENLDAPKELMEAAEKAQVPVLRTPLVSSKATSLTTDFLIERLAPRKTVHGVLLEMFGLGVFIIGDSGIGKSECALDLIARHHRLVADDAVEVRRMGKKLRARAPNLTFEHLEIHGLGIVNVREIFGVSSICETIDIDICIELKRWSEVENIERIGLTMLEHNIFELSVPKFVLPVRPGRTLSTLVETAVKVFLLKGEGFDAAERLIEKHNNLVSNAQGKI
jgi:HPr kinase/phosphorylase